VLNANSHTKTKLHLLVIQSLLWYQNTYVNCTFKLHYTLKFSTTKYGANLMLHVAMIRTVFILGLACTKEVAVLSIFDFKLCIQRR